MLEWVEFRVLVEEPRVQVLINTARMDRVSGIRGRNTGTRANQHLEL